MRRALTGLLAAAGVASLWLTVTLALRVRVLDDMRDLTRARVHDADSRANSALQLLVIISVPLAAVWIAWQYRVLIAARQRGRAMRWEPWWAVAGWLIPVANLVLPAWQLRDASTRAKGLILAWAIAFNLGFLALLDSSNKRPDDAEVTVGPNLDKFIQADRSAAVGALLLTAAAVLGVLIVRRVCDELDVR